MLAPLLALIALQYHMVGASDASIAAPSDPLITPGPRLEVRTLSVDDPHVLGWEVDGGTIVQRTCGPGLTYSLQAPFYQCCTTDGPCPFATACSGLYDAVYSPLAKSHCAGTCITGLLFASTDDPSPYSYLGCATKNFWVVKSKDSSGLLSWTPPAPVATKTLQNTESSQATILSQSSGSQSTGSSAAETSSPPSTTPSKKTNIGPIVGGVIGGVAVLFGLVGLAVFFCLRHKKNARQTPPPPPQMAAAPIPQQQYQGPTGPAEMANSYVQPNSPPPGYKGQPPQGGYFAPGQKSPSQPYQYEAVPNDPPRETTPQPYPQGVAEVHGTTPTHAVELQ